MVNPENIISIIKRYEGGEGRKYILAKAKIYVNAPYRGSYEMRKRTMLVVALLRPASSCPWTPLQTIWIGKPNAINQAQKFIATTTLEEINND